MTLPCLTPTGNPNFEGPSRKYMQSMGQWQGIIETGASVSIWKFLIPWILHTGCVQIPQIWKCA